MDYAEAIELFENGNINNCINYFKANNNKLEYAYCLLLSGDLDNAEKEFRLIKSHRADWALKLITLIRRNNTIHPEYFEIRSFLEIDLALILQANQTEYAQYIIESAEIFRNANSESYKFIGRALLKNGYTESAKMFLDKSLSEFYHDPELHYLFVEYYLMNNDFTNAEKAVKNCLQVNPDYFPAKQMKKKLINQIQK